MSWVRPTGWPRARSRPRRPSGRSQQVADKQWAWGGNSNAKLLGFGVEDPDAPKFEFNIEGIQLQEILRQHVYGCFIDDPVGVQLIDFMGIDNVMAETDYPHSDSTWPDSILIMRDQLKSLSDADRRKVLRGNAERLFQFKAAQPRGLPGIVHERGLSL